MSKSVETVYKKDGDTQQDEARTEEKGTAGHMGGSSRHRKNFSTAQQSAQLDTTMASKKQPYNLVFLVKLMEPSLAEKHNNVCFWAQKKRESDELLYFLLSHSRTRIIHWTGCKGKGVQRESQILNL